MNSDEKFRNKVKYTKFVLAFLIVLIHVINFQPIFQFDNTIIKGIWGTLLVFGQIGVPCYFAISGFLFFYKYDKSQLLGKYKRRIRSLIIPYITWNTLILLVYYLYDKLGIYHEEGFSFTFFSVIKEILYCSRFSPLWFIRTLVVYLLVCPVIVMTWRNRVIAVVEIFVLSISVYFIQTPIISNYYIGIFLMGAYFAIFRSSLIMNSTHSLEKSAMILMLLFLLTFSVGIYIQEAGYGWIYTLRWLGVCLFWFIMDLFQQKSNHQMKHFMNYSFPVYCLHCPIIRIGKCVGNYILLNNELGGGIMT